MTWTLQDQARGILCGTLVVDLKGINPCGNKSAPGAVEIFIVPIRVDLWACEDVEATALLNKGLEP